MIKNLPTQLAGSTRRKREELQRQIETAAFDLTRAKNHYRNWRKESTHLRRTERNRARQEWRTQLAEYKTRMQEAWYDYQEWMLSVEMSVVT